MRKKKTTAIVGFLLVFLFWVLTISRNTFGFIAPHSLQAVGFDLWTALVWFAFVYSIWNLSRVFATKP